MSRSRISRSLGDILAGATMVTVLAASLALAGPASAADATSRWAPHLRAVDEALSRGDAKAAERAWHEAYLAALGSWRWQGMLEVGEAYLRIGAVTGSRKAAEAKARNSYLSALFRARNDGSLEGVLRAARAFAALGDREVVDGCLRMADNLAGAGDAEGRDRIRELATRLAGPLIESRIAEAGSF